MKKLRVTIVSVVCLLALTGVAYGARESNVAATKHNLSSSSPNKVAGSIYATSETQICVFCHTPHAATSGAVPLWNRVVPLPTSYTGYSSSSLDAPAVQAGYNGQPGGSSKLCLSCHDGTLALGTVNVVNGGATPIAMTDTGGNAGKMPLGAGSGTGYTRNLGANLTTDHPISLSYTAALTGADGELRTPDANQQYPIGSVNPNIIIGIRDIATHPGDRPLLPLATTGAGGLGQVQCGTCHDPHIRETDATKGNQKMLRVPRFQEVAPTATYIPATDQGCIACHDKNGAAGNWAYSAHGSASVANETYVAAAANRREFPTGAAYNQVWNVGCLNCHDTHAVSATGAVLGGLLREGVAAALTGGTYAAGGYKTSGAKASEETCYQCHTLAANSAIVSAAPLIDIQTQMTTSLIKHANATAAETHAAYNADGVETQANLGVGNNTNRHAECQDCHNPHRVAKVQKISDVITGAGYVAGGVHKHEDATGYIHDNIASGVLRGSWGVEPVYTNTSAGRSFFALPASYTVKRGVGTTTAVGDAHVTREYQVCLKCHSDYGYTDDNILPSGLTRPLLNAANTVNGRTLYTRYTNQAREFQAPSTHTGLANGKSLGTESGAGATFNANNARSWHPVIGPTGRSTYGTYKAPWNNAGARGVQTMYCSDCHGSQTASATSVIPDNRSPTAAHVAASSSWGPHGGAYKMMLKGTWYPLTSGGAAGSGLCLKCHTLSNSNSGFGSSTGHADSKHNKYSCSSCHIAVVHGWKNKSFLVNLKDVGPEAGLATGTDLGQRGGGGSYNVGPYYMGAQFYAVNWKASGSWAESDCGHNHK